MTEYPGGVYSPRTKENKAGIEYDPTKRTIGYAEDVTKLDDEVVALEKYLGLPADQAGKILKVKVTEDGLEFTDLPAPGFTSRARAYISGESQSIPSDTFTKVNLDAKSFDGDDEFDTANKRFTAKSAGYYLICAAINTSWSWFDEQILFLSIKKNGQYVNFAENVGSGGESISVVISDIRYLAANDYIELFTLHRVGMGASIAGGSSETFMAIHRLS